MGGRNKVVAHRVGRRKLDVGEEPGEVVILKVEDSDDDSDEETESYVSVEDEETLTKVFEIFKDKFKNEFDFVD